jgi:glycosyltransferase involved in cell wall biosynthesis
VTRIFGWSADPGTSYWRLRLPLVELAARGHDVMVDDRMPDCVNHGAEADVVVASRTCNPGPSETFQRLCHENRMLCVYDTDDDLFTVTPDNTAHKYFHGDRHEQLVPIAHAGSVDFRAMRDGSAKPDIFEVGEVEIDRLRHIRDNLAAAHLVTTSTEHLANVLRQCTTAPVVVLPNHVPRWATELPAPWEREPRTRVVAGHTGGSSHARDFGEVAKPLRSWLQRHGEHAEFHAIGADSTPRVTTIRSHTRHTKWTADVAGYLSSIDFDIGLAPLRGTEFARSKSPLKAMEYGALGIPVVASDVEPYSGYVQHGVTGFLCRTAKDWRTALDALMDPDLRHAMGLANRLQACEHLIEDHAHLWLEAYERAMAGKVSA